jgi:glycosyltransferase involved in cell wall biosynthesis
VSRLRDAGIGAAGALLAVGAWRAVSRRPLATSWIRSDLDRRRPRPPAPGDLRLTVVVPAFAEQGRIGDTVRRLRAELDKVATDGGLEIIVVDDGSPDSTAREAERAGADRVVRHPRNRGKGAAVRTGVLLARGRTIAFTDADLAYSPDQILGLLEEVEAGWDVVVGSRRHTETTTLVRARRLREVGGRAINLLTRAVLLGHYRDTQCGLKAFRSDVARVIFTHCRIDGFAFDVEVFHLIERYHLSLAELPVRVENSPTSTVKVVRDALKLVRDLFRIRRFARQGVYDPLPGELDPGDLPVA